MKNHGTTANLSDEVEPAVAERVATLAEAGGELLELRDVVNDAALLRVLGEACRRSPARLLVWQIDSVDAEPVPAEVFFAFGFRRLLDCEEAGCRHVLHEFSLVDYKSPPDWLNARFWAHPERFGLDPDDRKPQEDRDQQ